MYRISTFAVIATTVCFSGCADKSEAPKQEILNAVGAARSSGLIHKVDEQLQRAATRIVAKKGIAIPQGGEQDIAVAQRGQAALMAYFGIPQAVDQVTQLIASARKLYAQNVVSFDQAVEGINMADSVFPNYSVYEFVRATIEIISNDIFDIQSDAATAEIQKALACASDKRRCGSVSPMTLQVLSVKDRILSLIPPSMGIRVSELKLVFLPLYVLVNHASIPLEYREIFMTCLTGLADLAEAIEADPESAEAIFRDLFDRVELTREETAMLINIQNHIATIARALGVGGYVNPVMRNALVR